MDVISSALHGIDHVIASQGTAFTTQQLEILYKTTKNILIAFDNDNAGTIAGEKLFKAAVQVGFIVDKVVIPPQYKDLDDYFFSSDWTEAAELNVIPYLSFILDQYKQDLINPNSHDKKKAIEHVLTLIAPVDEITGQLYLQELSSLSAVNQQTLSVIYEQYRQEAQSQQKNAKPSGVGSEGEQFTPRINQYGHLRVAFQKLLLTKVNPEVLALLYEILQLFIPEFQNYTFDEYIIHITDELELMRESGQYSYTDPVLMFDSLMNFLDRNISKFILDPTLKQSYQTLKAYKDLE